MIPDQTIRNEYGSADMVAFLRRDAGELGVQLREWERHPAALELHRRGWEPERIAHAVGIHSGAVRDLIAGTKPTARKRVIGCKEQRERRWAERVEIKGQLVHPRAKHGTEGGYGYYGCRCTPCGLAHTEYNAVRRSR